MNLVCKKCGAEVTEKDVDVATQTAFCPSCEAYWECRDWIQTHFRGARRLANPPPGASYEQTGTGFEVAVSARSWMSIVWILFAAFASAIMSFFAYALFFAKALPGSHSDPAVLNNARLFLAPHFVFTICLWFAALYRTCGKVVVRLDGDTATIFQGVASIGWRRRVNWAAVRRVRLANHYDDDFTRDQLVLEADLAIILARGVSHERLLFLMTALLTHQPARRQGANPEIKATPRPKAR